MPDQIAFYLQQAALCAKAAEEAELPNQREKFLDAQAAWQALADKAAHVRAEGEKRDMEKAARQANH